VEPVAVVLVNALSANLEFNGVDEVVTDVVEPAELGARAVRRLELYLRERRLEVDAVDQVAVAADRARDTLAEVGSAVEGLLNRLHREVRVTAVHDLEERDLGVTRKVDVLSAIGYELH